MLMPKWQSRRCVKAIDVSCGELWDKVIRVLFCGPEWYEIDLSRRLLVVRRGKNGQQARHARLNSEAFKALVGLQKRSDGTEPGKPTDTTTDTDRLHVETVQVGHA